MASWSWSGRVTRRDFLRQTAVLSGAGALAAACGTSGASGGASAGAPIKAKIDGDLNYFNWTGYVPASVISGFEKEYGVKVNQTFFDDDQTMLTKLAAGLPYDIAFTNSAYMRQLIGGGLIRPLPHNQLKYLGVVIPFFRNPPYDPGARYSMPYGYSPTGIAWLTDRVSGMTGSWNDLWDHRAASGHIFVLDQIEEALGASLLRLGYPIDSANPAQVNKAADALISLKPMLAGFSTADYTNLENGSGWIQHAWSGDVYIALGKVKDTGSIRFETCREGIPIGVDTMSIPAKAQHPGTALLFIDWILRPDNSRACVANMGQANGTTAGNAAFNKLVADFPFLQTSDEILAKGAWKKVPTGAQQQLWAQAWSRVKAS